mgnify:CR=1 FL=1
MTKPDPQISAETTLVEGFASAVAADLELFALLQDREWSAAVIEAARACPISEQLGLVPDSPAGIEAMGMFDAALAALPETVDERVVNEMASDYADVYLRHFHRASPTESVWMTEDGLERQEPMFQVQAWYRRNNLRVTDQAQRPDDHIVFELRFLAHLFAEAAKGGPGAADKLAEAARFLDAHPLRCVGLLAERLMTVGASPVFASLSRVTATYLETVRSALVEIAGVARPVPELTLEAKRKKAKEKTCADPDEKPFIPGIAPSW